MKNYNSLVGLSPELRAVLADTGVSGLPVIRGEWMIVDPYKVTEASGGIEGAFASIETAYAACVSGRGDGILVLSGGTTATTTSSFLKAPIEWSKHAITVYGVAAGGYNSRARVTSHAVTTSATFVTAATVETIVRSAGSFVTDGWEVGMTGIFDNSDTNANVTFTVTAVSALTLTGTVGTDLILTDSSAVNVLQGYFPYLINVSGANNRFYNLYLINESSHASNVGALAVSGARNVFVNCHFSSNNTLGSAAVGCYDVRLSASENQFVRCWIGNNNTARSGAANGNIHLGLSTTQIGQNVFEDCYILSYSVTTTHGAVKVADVATLGGWVTFTRCKFINWNNAKTYMATIIIGATPTNWGILLDHCSSVGYTAMSANDDMSFATPYVANGVASLGQSV